MSQRLAQRVPKRMLVFFNEDNSTSILNTSKVVRILSGESKISEGSSVEVEYDGCNYEALVVRLHGKYYFGIS
jgi:hypothetical protein